MILDVGSSDVKHMNSVLSNREQDTIPAHNHLANLLRELVVFRSKRKAFGDETELFGNYCT